MPDRYAGKKGTVTIVDRDGKPSRNHLTHDMPEYGASIAQRRIGTYDQGKRYGAGEAIDDLNTVYGKVGEQRRNKKSKK